MTNAKMGEGRRDAIVSFISEFVSKHEHAPTVREIAEGVGLSSPGPAHRHLERLVKDGRLVRTAVTRGKIVYMPAR